MSKKKNLKKSKVLYKIIKSLKMFCRAHEVTKYTIITVHVCLTLRKNFKIYLQYKIIIAAWLICEYQK